MNEPVLELESVSKSYNRGMDTEVSVLQAIDLRITAGEIVALVAPSGAGKSTLLHIAGLLDSADTGTVRVTGEAVDGLSDRRRTAIRRTDVGFIYQFHHLLPEFTALENIVLPQLANGASQSKARAHAMTLLDAVGLTARAEHRPSAMSGGEQQRVAFCRALANRPRLLLADEPTGNLDPNTSNTVFDTLLSLVRETGMAALIATHNPDLAKRMDRILKLENGFLAAA